MTASSSPPSPGMKSVPAAFWECFTPGMRGLLMLDYDGTLAPFRDKRDEATPYPGLRPLLAQLRDKTRLVIVSGRPVHDLIPLLGLDPAPEIFGAHGWEHLRAGEHVPEVFNPGPEVRNALERAAAWIHDNGHGPRSEHKAASVTIHWRAEPHDVADRLKAEARATWEPLVVAGTELHAFDGGLEFRATGRTKGNEEEASVPAAFLGDDVTDEDAFAELRPDDLGVLVRPEWRATQASAWLRPPEELVEFLRKWLELAEDKGKNHP